MKHNRIVLTLGLLGLAGLVLMLNLTSPTDIGPLGVLAFFTMLYVVFFAVAVFCWKLFYKAALGRKIFRPKDYLYAAIAAFGPIMLLMARSFGVVTIWTVSLVVIFIILAEFLAMKRL